MLPFGIILKINKKLLLSAMNSNKEKSGSESSDSTDSSSDSPSPGQQPVSPPQRRRKRKARSTKRKSKRRRTDDAIARLAEEVGTLKDFISSVGFHPTGAYGPDYQPDCQSEVSANVSGELYSENEAAASNTPCDVEFSLNTVLKEPSVPKSLPAHVEILKSIQHFEKYCSSPGFNFLETNDELKPYDKSNALALIERGFAAITQAVIKHNEAAQAGFKSLIEWASSTRDLSPKSLQEKIGDIFVKGSYQKTCADTLQLTCGHRAEIIQQRRDSVLKSVKDSFVKASLRKIPAVKVYFKKIY